MHLQFFRGVSTETYYVYYPTEQAYVRIADRHGECLTPPDIVRTFPFDTRSVYPVESRLEWIILATQFLNENRGRILAVSRERVRDEAKLRRINTRWKL